MVSRLYPSTRHLWEQITTTLRALGIGRGRPRHILELMALYVAGLILLEKRLLIRELKAAYALDKIPMHDFADNEAFFHLVLFAYNLLSWFKRLCAPPGLQRATLQRLRRHLFLAPAQLVRPRGRPVLRLARAYPFPGLPPLDLPSSVPYRRE